MWGQRDGSRFSPRARRRQPHGGRTTAPRGGPQTREGPCTFALLIPNEPRKGAADWTLETAIPLLSRAAGGPVEGIVGEADPFEAVKSALRQQPGFDEVIISTLPKRVSEWIRRDLPHRVVTLGVPVTTISPHEEGERPPVIAAPPRG